MQSATGGDENALSIEVLKDIREKLSQTTNNFHRANLQRESAFILFQESARHSVELSSAVLDDALETYKSIVTSTGEGSVNNYTDRVVRLLKRSRKPVDLSKWSTSIAEQESTTLAGLNKCAGEFESCARNEVIDADLKHFREVSAAGVQKRKMPEARTIIEEAKGPVPAAAGSSYQNDPFFDGQELSNPLDVRRTAVFEASLPQQQQAESRTRESFLQPVIAKPFHDPYQVAGPSKAISVGDVPANDRPKQPAAVANSFRTARDELALQNLRKYGGRDNLSTSTGRHHSDQPLIRPQQQTNMTDRNQLTAPQNLHTSTTCHEQPLFSYGASKKSLGARRTVQSKFIPPIKNTSEGTCNVADADGRPTEAGNEHVVIDERLKNIDQKMVELISNEIMWKLKPVGWDDIAGLEYAKSTIQEAVVWPMLRPDIFTGLRRPPRGILLFGPPGTGKTLIGKCIASQSNSTFFSISASSLTSKWVGDGEKMVRALFAVAAVNQPSVIFIDEVDSLLCQRSETEHESSRRIKTEFLVQLDGAMTSDEERILIVGATNRPQELDDAARRRFIRRLYIPLPEHQARLQILNNLLQSVRHSLTDTDIDNIGKLSHGYSGADMESLCREASMEPIRSIPPTEILYFNENEVRPINFLDFRKALNRIRASVSQNDLQQYVNWNEIYGSGASC